ncbi:MAG TPA: hypothetical protein VN578_16655, partial [Candidatus Binatia bacterium]|nr:hypothetical protein [Candidatus Binatia bacterium]
PCCHNSRSWAKRFQNFALIRSSLMQSLTLGAGQANSWKKRMKELRAALVALQPRLAGHSHP